MLISDDIVRQSIAWKLRLDAEPDNQLLQNDCTVWQERHPQHQLAWQRMQSLGNDLQSVQTTLPDSQQMVSILKQTSTQAQRRKILKLLSIAAVGSTVSWVGYKQRPFQADYTTGVGQNKSLTLVDGTALMLNTDTSVDIRFSQTERLIVLHRGEIHIQSGVDPESSTHRPLKVQSKQALMEALGTRFLVRQNDNSSYLQVSEGRVSIKSYQGGSKIAEAGEAFDIGQAITRHNNKGMDATGWTQGMLIINDMRLDNFLTELSRYRHGYLRCDINIAHLRLSGVFQLDQTDQILAILPRQLPVKIISRTRWWVSLTAR